MAKNKYERIKIDSVDVTKEYFGYLAETEERAKKNGLEPNTGLHWDGLEKYLNVIFPNNKFEWNKSINVKHLNIDNRCSVKPDYVCEELKMVVEYDGKHHFKEAETIARDKQKDIIYKKLGYKVVRIPYFIQLTNDVVRELFGVDVKVKLFNPKIPSLCGNVAGFSPKDCTVDGFNKMVEYFVRFPQQYKINLKYLKRIQNEDVSGANMLEQRYNEVKKTVKKIRKSRPNFNFYKMGLNDGDVLVYKKDNSITCNVAGRNRVLYNGKEYSLTGITMNVCKNVDAPNRVWVAEKNGELLVNLYNNVQFGSNF